MIHTLDTHSVWVAFSSRDLTPVPLSLPPRLLVLVVVVMIVSVCSIDSKNRQFFWGHLHRNMEQVHLIGRRRSNRLHPAMPEIASTKLLWAEVLSDNTAITDPTIGLGNGQNVDMNSKHHSI